MVPKEFDSDELTNCKTVDPCFYFLQTGSHSPTIKIQRNEIV